MTIKMTEEQMRTLQEVRIKFEENAYQLNAHTIWGAIYLTAIADLQQVLDDLEEQL